MRQPWLIAPRAGGFVTFAGLWERWRVPEGAVLRGSLSELKDWNGDLAVAGLVKKSGQALSLWFVPRSGAGTLGREDQPYQLEDVTLDADFHDDLRAQLTAVALAAMAPLTDSEVRGRVLEKGLATNTIRSCAPSGGVHRIETRTFEALAKGSPPHGVRSILHCATNSSLRSCGTTRLMYSRRSSCRG